MRIDYARTSTTEQEAGLEAQRRELTAYGCEELFEEQVSSVSRRDELERCLKFVRKGDSLVVTKLDRLARSVPDLVKIIRRLEEKGATLNILAMNLDTSSPTGRLSEDRIKTIHGESPQLGTIPVVPRQVVQWLAILDQHAKACYTT